MRVLLFSFLFCLLGSGVLAQRTCYSCDSATDTGCATLMTDLGTQDCEDPNETECVVTIFGERTLRGCKSEVETLLSTQCSGESCALCSTDLCNGIVYPENRLICHKCTTCDYIQNNANLGICPNYQAGDFCYVVVDQVANPETSTVEIISHRGCASDQDESYAYCLSHPEKCQSCSSIGCNTAGTYSESSLSCYKCDSVTDYNCPFAQDGQQSSKCDYNTFLGTAEHCYTYTKLNGEISRGCVLELSADSEIRQKCEANDEQCQKCTGSECNQASTEEDYGKCVLCDGYTDPNCAKLGESYAEAICGPSEVGGCFRADVYGAIVRACVSDLLPGELEKCKRGVDCKICQGDLCNAKIDFPVCHKCDSRTDPDCVDYQSSAGKVCDDYLDVCAAYIDLPTGATVRGCKKELSGYTGCPSGDDYCVECEQGYCNAAAIPWFRSKCFQCEGLTCASPSLDTSKYCYNYQDNDQCYTVAATVEGETQVYRGCMSDAETHPGKLLCDSQGDNCVKCTGSECNRNILTTQSTLSCHTCDSASDPNCSLDKATSESSACGYSLVLGVVDQCYQHSDETGIRRGCLHNAPIEVKAKCDAGSEECKLCGENGCNSEAIETYGQCYSCDGTTNSNCETLTGISSIYCPAGERQGCFRSEVDGMVVRGCVSQLLAGEVNLCESGRVCKLCEGDNCNGKVAFQSCYACNAALNPYCVISQISYESTKTVCSDYLDECVTYTDNGVTYRGCANELSVPSTCPSGSCTICSGNDCNVGIATVPSELSCHVCDSATDAGCMDDQSSAVTTLCSYNLVVGRADQCYTYQDGDSMRRGCLYNSPIDVQMGCESGSEECNLCGTSGCNSKEASYGQCYFCDGTSDSNCETMVDVEPMECPKGDRSGCFRSEVDGKVVRGCVSQLQPGEVNLCEAGRVCKICEGDNCNGKLSFQSCYACNAATNPYCVISQSSYESTKATCSDYLDECVTYTENGVTHRGCAKELNVPATCPSGSCTKCSANDCNVAIATVPSELMCHVCDSSVDPDCVSDQSNAVTTLCNYNLVVGRADSCYVHDNGETVRRGCLNNSPLEVQMDCAGGEEACGLCGTSGCNSDAVEGYEQCYFCDGTSDSNCETMVGIESMVCPKGDRKGCFRSEVDGKVVRGCASQLSAGEERLCEAGRVCKFCEGDHCNGKLNFQSCYACNAATNPACVLAQTSANTKAICSSYLDECVTYTENGVTSRGCANELNVPATCPSASCVKCAGNNCNAPVATAPSELMCHICDSTVDPTCQEDQSNAITTLCNYNLVVGREDQCYTYVNGDTVTRGCLHNSPFALQVSCSSGDSKCSLCGISGCNSEAYTKETYGECYFCDGTIDSNCETMEDIQSIECPKGDRQGCFRSQIDGKVVRGCISHLTAGEVSLCERGRTCKFCEGDNCNGKLNFQSCYSCNSATDSNCVEDQDADTSTKTTCSEYLDECVTYIDSGVTYRGCAMQSELPSTCTASTCSYCNEENCNAAIYPTNRMKCHQCSGASDECVNGLNTELSVCKNYIAGDACYTTYTDDKSAIYRGCMSDADTGSALCSQNGDATCTRCLASGCNFLAAVSSPSLSCVKCFAGDDNEIGCGYGYQSTDGSKCHSNVWLGQTESCYTVHGSQGISRGCTIDDVNTCPDNDTCEKCTSDSCNSKSYNKYKCYQCNSNVAGQGTCAQEAEDLEVTECPGDDQKLAEIGCYLWKKDDDSVERGCLSTLTAAMKNECIDDDSETCEYCLGEGCNNQNAGAAALTAISSIVLLLVAFLVWH